MDLSFLAVQFLTGLASASSLFIIASGLTIVFGVTRIVNFAHGSFFMLGAYVAVTLLPRFYGVSASFPMFLVGILVTALVVGLLGVLLEVIVLRRIYQVPELFQLLATFGVLLVVEDLTLQIWGAAEILGPRVPGMTGAGASISIFQRSIPTYDVFLAFAGPMIAGVLWLVMHRTRFGVLVRAATQDREMVAALGVNQAWLFTGTLFLGSALAGLGGALQSPKVAANLGMDIGIITEAFVVTVIGGMGSVPGALLAALLIGELQAFGILVFPQATLVFVFVLMAAVLFFKPWGLLGRPDPQFGQIVIPDGFAHLPPINPRRLRWAAGALLAAAMLPIIADNYLLKVAIEVLAFALAAFSLAFLISNGGIVSFGHAAYFGTGAYTAALAVKSFGAPMELALIGAPLVAALLAAVYGYFIVRLSGIYLAMLTLAVAQITYAIAFQWVGVTGGDNGIVGVWPSRWAAARVTYYYLVLVLATGAIATLWYLIYTPFGVTMRAVRDSASRAGAIGIDVMIYRWMAFTIAGGAAGLAGALFAFSKGSIDPTLLSISMSVDFLSMVLLGGLKAIWGAPIGAAVLHLIKDAVMPLTEHWRLLLGLAIISIVLLFPHGLAGAAEEVIIRLAPSNKKVTS